MRKIITTTFVTLDGVMQAPGGKEEDATGGFAYGGWQMSFPHDEEMSAIMSGFFSIPFELLLGRVTYDIFAPYWPTATTDLEVADPFNRTKKYVVSHESFCLHGAIQFVFLMTWWESLRSSSKRMGRIYGCMVAAISFRHYFNTI